MTQSRESSHRTALTVAVVAVVAILLLSVISYASTSTSTTVSISIGGIGGEFGFAIGQGTPASAAWSADSTATVTVDDASAFSVGDYLLIDDDTNGQVSGQSASTFSYHTVTDVNGSTLTVSPTIDNDYSSLPTSVLEQAPNSAGATWDPRLGSTSSITAGNHFIINLQGLSISDAALVEIFVINTDELVKNYTYLHRLVNVSVLCDSSSACAAGSGIPYETSTSAGTWGQAEDAAGTPIGGTNGTGDYLTLTNARQAFILIGGYTYALTIDGGTLFTIDVTTGAGDSLSPTDLVQLTAL